MTDADTWATIAALRAELIDQLVELPADAWDTPSLCPGWRVRDVVAHTILPERFSPVGGGIGFARAGFSLRRLLHTDAIRRGSAPLDELVASFREAIGRQVPAPGRTPQHLLDDLYVHARDIRRPLGLAAPSGSLSYDPAVLTGIADAIASDRGLRVPPRIAGLALVATDIPWQHGGGAEVSGPIEALILAMTGRRVALDELAGEGLGTLTMRLL
jgi:uncharacterized protein (TIGR03083 family)